MTSNKGFSLKDQLFNQEKVRYLAGLFYAADRDFDAVGFEAEVMETMLDLELKARMNLTSEVLENYLPSTFPLAAERIHAALPPPLDPTKTDDDFGLFIFGSLGEYVARNGLTDLSVALPLLREITKRFSMEFALRHFLIAAQDETMVALEGWVQDDNYHVRRLVSEGTRPTLPWGLKTGLEASDPLPFLDVLHADGTRFVTRSVANHLNDISKKDPALVVNTLSRWRDMERQDAVELGWMTRHALRTLVKKGDKAALALLGYHDQPDILVSDFTFPPSVQLGDTGTTSFNVTANSDENLMIDYVIDFVKANGKTAPKVFKLKKLALKKGQTVAVQKAHRFLKGSTTFTHYTGAHRITLQINGQNFGDTDFALI
jgi:3-methyladenine DNA glycosylase AlkC